MWSPNRGLLRVRRAGGDACPLRTEYAQPKDHHYLFFFFLRPLTLYVCVWRSFSSLSYKKSKIVIIFFLVIIFSLVPCHSGWRPAILFTCLFFLSDWHQIGEDILRTKNGSALCKSDLEPREKAINEDTKVYSIEMIKNKIIILIRRKDNQWVFSM